MIILGLTGSIGMGKSTTAAFFKKYGIAVYSSDEAVHELYLEEPALSLIEETFPNTVINGEVSRQNLSSYVVGNSDNLKKLEAIIHPLVRKKEQDFIKFHQDNCEKLVVLDIPLLFETGGESRVDKIAVVSTPYDIQRTRVLARENMSEEKFAAILKRQMPDSEKRARADFIIDTSQGLIAAEQAVQNIIKTLTENTKNA
ncbi:dephospho-CoA kinase [Bartonella sp. HY761]|uniref:dephospho-CoA kinase n=1 Tax=Bartonella sp. HY761 TaxID=2979330 RepID=UPI0022099087|nr:dephospho-CoA kinase [Bartonella sp. HY761]UXN06319.1 dephospho-CoA kinase [Bartonella sp. HY761]